MACDVHISICFPLKDAIPGAVHDAIVELVKTFPEGNQDTYREAQDFLQALSENRGYCCGRKGPLFTWGYVGNYTNVEDVAKLLMPVWKALYIHECLCYFEHIIVFEEWEQSKCATAYEISAVLGDGDLQPPTDIKIVKHDCPFAWMQF